MSFFHINIITRFMKIAGSGTRADVMTYAFFHAFKFPDSMSVQIKCKVKLIQICYINYLPLKFL